MLTLFRRIKMLRAFLSLVKNPANTDLVFALSDQVRSRPSVLLEPTLKYISQLEGVAELYEQKYNPSLPALAELLQYPANSFGQGVGLYLKNNNLKLDFFPIAEGESLQSYVLNRARKHHDLWHVVTGFGVSIADEVGLQAFTLAQLNSPFSAMILAGGILHSLTHNPAIFHQLILQMFAGYALGKNTRPLLGIKLEEMLNRDLSELREELRLQQELRPESNSYALRVT